MADPVQEFEQRYRATSYWARTPRGAVEIRIGLTQSILASILSEYGLAEWIFISACNPGSRLKPDAENDRAQLRLLERLRLIGAIVFEGAGVPDRDDWPAEPSFLALGATTETGSLLAAEFAQNAFVAGRGTETARLVFK